MLTSSDQIATAIHDAIASAVSVRPVGSATWLHGGPVQNRGTPLSVRAMQGVVEYTPGDLVITVGAGTTLEELAALTAEHGQMLALAPYGSLASTIGAVVATASTSPLPYDDLSVRDLVLGLTMVTGAGDTIRVGGRVVKNVAGFDLVRLATGSYGTLGVITEVSLRLHAMPAMDHIVSGTLDGPMHAWLEKLTANHAPLPMLVRLSPDTPPQLFARCSGNPARASALRGKVEAFGARNCFTVGVADTNHADHQHATTALLRTVPDGSCVVRVRMRPSQAAGLIDAARPLFPQATMLLHPARGTLRIITAKSESVATQLDQLRARVSCSIVIEEGLPLHNIEHPLDRDIKRVFDPHGILNHRHMDIA